MGWSLNSLISIPYSMEGNVLQILDHLGTQGGALSTWAQFFYMSNGHNLPTSADSCLRCYFKAPIQSGVSHRLFLSLTLYWNHLPLQTSIFSEKWRKCVAPVPMKESVWAAKAVVGLPAPSEPRKCWVGSAERQRCPRSQRCSGTWSLLPWTPS